MVTVLSPPVMSAAEAVQYRASASPPTPMVKVLPLKLLAPCSRPTPSIAALTVLPATVLPVFCRLTP